MALNHRAVEALQDYLTCARERGQLMGPEIYIFKTTQERFQDNRPLDPKAVNYILKKYAKIAGIKHHISIHSARATVIGSLLDKGVSIERVADFVGHKDLSTTRGYNKRKVALNDSLTHLLD
jgi:site-specific recombinase XerD